MTEPLSDESLAEYAEVAEIWRENMVARPEHWSETAAEAIPALLADVARLKAELASQAGYEQTLSDVDAIAHEHFNVVGNPMPQGTCFGEAALCLKEELASLRSENATLRDDNARLVAALEAQGQRAFVAGMRRKAPDLDALATRIESVVRCCYPLGQYGDVPPEAERAKALYDTRPNSMGFLEGQAMAVQTVVREMLESALEGEASDVLHSL